MLLEPYDLALVASEHLKLSFKLIGNINVDEGRELIMTTIPYDEGWKIYADGKEVALPIAK